jgi:hypothetical protein
MDGIRCRCICFQTLVFLFICASVVRACVHTSSPSRAKLFTRSCSNEQKKEDSEVLQ